MTRFNGNKDWFLGLDIGTNSVGWAVTDKEYNILKFNGNAMWGVYLFDEAQTAADRRTNRTARRRLERKKQRIALLQDFFAEEISKIDKQFFLRIKESGLWADDRSTSPHLFDNGELTDREYAKRYPTIHHLIMDLIEDRSYHDPRLVYLAVSYILSHRGHFLLDVGKNNVTAVTDFNLVYQELTEWFDSVDIQIPWKCTPEVFSSILHNNKGITGKIDAFKKDVFNGKIPTDAGDSPEDSSVSLSVKNLIEFICGKKIKVSDLFCNEDYTVLEKNAISASAADFDDTLEDLSNDIENYEYDLLCAAKKIYDWSLLVDILSGQTYISQAKINVYKKHQEDLKTLKYFIKKYAPEKYNMVFRNIGKDPNYSSYSYNCKNLGKNPIPKDYKMHGADEFCKYVDGIISTFKDQVEESDKITYQKMKENLALRCFCPKQMTSENRVIPYQLYFVELKSILDNASRYLEFLNERDKYGTVKDKILSLMTFKIPYYVGPLNSHSEFAWIQKKSDDKIYPWNFEEVVDLDLSEEQFIRKMTGKCTYLAGEDVLPKDSLLYEKFMVLNEINNISINGERISVEAKQGIYNDLFKRKYKVTVKNIREYLLSNGYMQKDDELKGIDISIKSNLKAHLDFNSYIKSGTLKEHEVEGIIARITSTTDRDRLALWIKNNFDLPEADIRKIAKFKYSDYGRLSKRFLTQIFDLDTSTGEVRRSENIVGMLWNTNENLMMLLSDRYGYTDNVKECNKKYYESNVVSLDSQLKDMYLSNSVKRPILRVIEIVDELRKIMGNDPQKVFIEMARGATEDQRNKRTKSRRDQITELFSCYKNNSEYRADIDRLLSELSSKSDSELRSEKLFLYFTQFGRCMYSGEMIDINDIGNQKAYDVDHIWPRSKVKDDSIDNKVLVKSEYNGTKGDKYPVPEEWRIARYGLWKNLLDKNLISEKKFDRLTRKTIFTDEELAGFINRQLVETRQSTKAVANILGERLGDSKIVYVKAGLVSEFRQIYKDFYTLKCREVNDLHHAKDAYLNIVMGNVYNVKYTDNPLNFIKSGEQYTLNLNKMLEREIKRGNEIAWIAEDDAWFNRVINTIHKNNIRFVRYSYCQKGALFDIQPVRKGLGQVPRKTEMNDISKYGGYNKQSVTGYYLISYDGKKDRETALFPVPLTAVDLLKTQDDKVKFCEANGYLNTRILLNGRIIKTNTLFEIDGYRVHLSGKSTDSVWFKGATQLVVGTEEEDYTKKIVNYYKKTVGAKELPPISEHDGITEELNCKLYGVFLQKINSKYSVLMETAAKTIESGKTTFESLDIQKQVIALYHILELFGCSNSHGKDLTSIKGAANSGIQKMSLKINKDRFNSIRIIDQSPTGLFETKTQNIIEL